MLRLNLIETESFHFQGLFCLNLTFYLGFFFFFFFVLFCIVNCVIKRTSDLNFNLELLVKGVMK